MRFELFIATRYLRAKRRQAVIGVITGISIAGVAAGVASLVVALAINNGFRQDLQNRLLGSTSHINLLRIESDGIKDWRPLMDRLVKAASCGGAGACDLRAGVDLAWTAGARSGVEGMIPAYERKVSDLLNTVKIGSMDPLEENGVQTQACGRVFDPAWAGQRPAPHGLRIRQPQSPDDLNSVQERVAAMPPIVLGKDIAEDLGRHAEFGRAGHQSAGRTDAVWVGAEIHPLSRGGDFQLRLF